MQTNHETVRPDVHKLQISHVRVGALAAIAAAAFVLAWLVFGDGGGEKAAPPAVGAPTAASESSLKALASSVGHPVYWAGPTKGSYEVTRTSDGRIYVRYVPSKDKVGDRAAKYLTVGTYPRRNAFAVLKRAAKQKDVVSVKIGRGGLALFNSKQQTNVYFAYPGESFQIEVFAPSAQTARTLVLSGRVRPID